MKETEIVSRKISEFETVEITTEKLYGKVVRIIERGRKYTGVTDPKYGKIYMRSFYPLMILIKELI